ncbi:MAG: tyrosine-type recombinase/integrase [Chloroflexota bacterium]
MTTPVMDLAPATGGMPVDLVTAAEFHRHALQRLNRSPQTLKLYKIYQDSYLTFLGEQSLELSLDVLTPQFVRLWQSWLRSRSTGRRGGVVTERQGVLILKTWARWLMEQDVYSFDPLARLKPPRVQKIHRKPFTEDEVTRLVQAASADPNPIRDRALLLMLLDTGCRVGELCAATLADLDVDEGVITFNRTKNGHPRVVKFRVPARRDGGPALMALRQWLRVREAQPGVNAIFTTRERFGLSARRVREIFVELGKVARVANAGPHRMRHTAASEFLAERPGAEIMLRSRLGHISHDSLTDYVTVSDPMASEAAGVASISSKWNLGSNGNHGGGAVLANRSQVKPKKAESGVPARFCPACGYHCGEGARFCAGCGKAVS